MFYEYFKQACLWNTMTKTICKKIETETALQ